MTDAIYYFGVFDMFAGSRFDVGQSLLALDRSCEIHCATKTDETGVFSIYSFETRQVFPFAC